MKKDESLIEWFMRKYRYLEQDPDIEILYENTDFGVGTLLTEDIQNRQKSISETGKK